MFKVDISDLPKSPGIYYFLDKNNRTIYIGKAKNIRNRLGSYFNNSAKNIKTTTMLQNASDVKYILTRNEVEAFLLELSMIQSEKPKFNILLKDSKSYPYIEITKHSFPRIVYTREFNPEKGFYFGPFVSSSSILSLIDRVTRTFPLRTCTDNEFNKGKACLKYQIKRCPAPCANLISEEAYSKSVESIKKIFKGDLDNIKQELKLEEKSAVEILDFEAAAVARDRLYSLNLLFQDQTIMLQDKKSIDFFYRYEENGLNTLTKIFCRGGRIISSKTEIFPTTDGDFLQEYIYSYYATKKQFPEILSADGGELDENIATLISTVAERKVIFKKQGYKQIFDIAKKNAQQTITDYITNTQKRAGTLLKLKEKLTLKEDLNRIECIDISHLDGNYTVGVSIVFEDGKFNKQGYRKYRIKSAKNDDFQSIYELMSRKIDNIIDKSEKQANLYLIDGGIGQLNVAIKASKDKGVSLNIVSISKGRSIKDKKFQGNASIESIHVPNRKNSLNFRRNDEVILFAQYLRDEAHRFAIQYQRNLSSKLFKQSSFLEIKGLGKKRVQLLLQHFPQLFQDKNITAEEIYSRTKIPLKICESIIESIQK